MKADFTRDAFRADKHFTRVLMQQGRVQLDSDWNEQAAILLRYLRTLAADMIGPFAGPAENAGFVPTPLPATAGAKGDFQLTAGRYYVRGVACELNSTWLPVALSSQPNKPRDILVAAWTLDGIQFADDQYVELRPANNSAPVLAKVLDIDQASGTVTLDQDVTAIKPVAVRRITTYLTQPDLAVATPLPAGNFFVYLDAWERLITYVEDDSIREGALNGADTAARSKLVAQVKAIPADAGGRDFLATLDPPNRGFLRAQALKPPGSDDPCTIAPDARYRGPQNQLYRVEIHSGGTVGAAVGPAPTFKWSRENGAVVFPILGSSGNNAFVLENFGRDDRFGLVEADIVEVQDDDSVLLNRADNLLVVQSVDRVSMTVTLSGTASGNAGKSPAKHPLLRRWDMGFDDTDEGEAQQGPDGAALIVEGDVWLDLENGVQIQFPAAAPGEAPAQYRTGDYWLIPARVTTADIIWPSELAANAQGQPVQSPVAMPPDGIDHYYAPLANITVDVAGGVTVTAPLTKTFPPAAP
jgi:hypothetical protein